jgi:hypothetical protein
MNFLPSSPWRRLFEEKLIEIHSDGLESDGIEERKYSGWGGRRQQVRA